MNFGFNEEQDMIRKSAADFVKGKHSMERLRHAMEDERGWSPELFKDMAELGWLGTVFPEEYGGLGMGYVELLCIQEELGKGLLPEPLHTSAILGGNAVLYAGNEAMTKDLLPKAISGEALLTLGAYETAGRFNLAHVETAAKKNGSGYVLNGEKSFVPDAAASDKIIVSARTSGAVGDKDGITLFILDRNAPGVTVTPIKTIDRRPRAMVALKDAKGEAVGEVGKGFDAIEKTIDRATVALCAEMLGGMEAALNMSVAYSKERVQFGKAIGSFQAIKHKAANMFVEMETSRSATYYATMAVDEGREDLRSAVSCAKALCSEAYLHIAKDAIQIFGGIGFTHECDVQFFYKRAVAANVMFGDADHHRDRYATEKGF